MRTYPEAIGTMACFTNVSVVSYAIPKEEEDDDDGGEMLGETGYGRWGQVLLFSKSTPSYDTDITILSLLPLRAK